MNIFQGETLSWHVLDGTIELTLDRAPCNEIGRATLADLEKFVAALPSLQREAHALIIHSTRTEGFCAGADLRETYRVAQSLPKDERLAALRDFLERIHQRDEHPRRKPLSPPSPPSTASPSAADSNSHSPAT